METIQPLEEAHTKKSKRPLPESDTKETYETTISIPVRESESVDTEVKVNVETEEFGFWRTNAFILAVLTCFIVLFAVKNTPIRVAVVICAVIFANLVCFCKGCAKKSG
ncbi:7653_t:CDS:1 [Paraglomus occultum]|uniref:7653_t:CDS:1 n=1 Tax=Paraglomus occultum TaxID=144539 RepID=A0A9N8VTY3_9GLOM|nr:7653_t:CDS:1 [Paraglomus occultum]